VVKQRQGEATITPPLWRGSAGRSTSQGSLASAEATAASPADEETDLPSTRCRSSSTSSMYSVCSAGSGLYVSTRESVESTATPVMTTAPPCKAVSDGNQASRKQTWRRPPGLRMPLKSVDELSDSMAAIPDTRRKRSLHIYSTLDEVFLDHSTPNRSNGRGCAVQSPMQYTLSLEQIAEEDEESTPSKSFPRRSHRRSSHVMVDTVCTTTGVCKENVPLYDMPPTKFSRAEANRLLLHAAPCPGSFFFRKTARNDVVLCVWDGAEVQHFGVRNDGRPLAASRFGGAEFRKFFRIHQTPGLLPVSLRCAVLSQPTEYNKGTAVSD